MILINMHAAIPPARAECPCEHADTQFSQMVACLRCKFAGQVRAARTMSGYAFSPASSVVQELQSALGPTVTQVVNNDMYLVMETSRFYAAQQLLGGSDPGGKALAFARAVANLNAAQAQSVQQVFDGMVMNGTPFQAANQVLRNPKLILEVEGTLQAIGSQRTLRDAAAVADLRRLGRERFLASELRAAMHIPSDVAPGATLTQLLNRAAKIQMVGGDASSRGDQQALDDFEARRTTLEQFAQRVAPLVGGQDRNQRQHDLLNPQSSM